ncbi:MAG: ATP-binding protein [bacterium]
MSAAALLTAAALAVLFQQYRREVEGARRLMLERGRTVLESLSAGIRTQGWMCHRRAERLGEVFGELTGRSGVVGIQLRDDSGAVVAQSGHRIPRLAAGQRRWSGSRLVMTNAVRFDGCGHRPGRPGRCGGGGGGAGCASASGQYVLTAMLDTSRVAREVNRQRIYFGIAGGLILAAIVFGTWLFLVRVRQRQLQTELLLAEKQAAQSDVLAQLGAGLAHETKNPLGVVRGLAQAVGDTAGASADVKQKAYEIVDEVDRTVGQINSFLRLSRPVEAHPEPVDLDGFFETFLPLLRAEGGGRAVEIRYTPSGLKILADEQLLRGVLLNLVANALQACGDTGIVSIEALGSGDGVTLTVRDDGCGITPEDLPEVKKPYFTRFENGCGLGLAICDQAARAHGWTLRIDSTPPGTTVTLEGIARAGGRRG